MTLLESSKRIFVNGAFDLIHLGHLDLLKYAASLGDYLVVAIDTDERIRYNKGNDRPVNNLLTRKSIMESFRFVDEVKVFGTDQELIDTIRAYSPHIMVKGSDWRGKRVIGEEFCSEVNFYERVNDESTTKTIEDFINRR
jgi:D-beta-D-heptose 7-phosphate kinase/D-beta-D-heptose 1-phosphate adenosyltransferase